jgi:glycosidase
LDYIQTLGATALWITPPVANQWWNPQRTYTGYHGYWASHFSEVDAHYGTLADLRAFSDAVHARDMRWIQDVVVNHTGDFFAVNPGGAVGDGTWYGAPRQAPFHLNDPRKPEHRAAGIYHFSPDLVDYGDPVAIRSGALSGLDDLNTENPQVRDSLRAIYGRWIREAGPDGFRFDTQMYVEPDFWDDFLWAEREAWPGVERVALAEGKEGFFTFGEIWVGSAPGGREGEDRIAEYLQRPGDRGADGALNFPMQGTLRRVFAEGAAASELTARIRLQAGGPAAGEGRERLWLNFLDNHDMPRFRRGMSEATYRAAMRTLLVLPGVPVIYQGTEQGDLEVRAPLFGRQDSSSAAFRWLREALAWRKDCGPCGQGEWSFWEREVPEAGDPWMARVVWEGDTIWVAMNPSDQAWHGWLEEGNQFWGAGSPEFEVQEGGEAYLHWEGSTLVQGVLPPWGWVAWRSWTPVSERSLAVERISGRWRVRRADGQDEPLNTELHCAAGDALYFDARAELGAGAVFDGGQGLGVEVVPGQPWRCDRLSSGSHRLTWMVTGRDGGVKVGEEARVRLTWKRELLVECSDPCGDDRGLDGRISPPTDATFTGQTDFKNLRVFREGRDWWVEIEACAPVRPVWNPRWGFDHVTWFLWWGHRAEVAEGVPHPAPAGPGFALPGIGGTMPAGFVWEVGITHGGWSLSAMTPSGDAHPVPDFYLDAERGVYRWRVPWDPARDLPGERCLYVTSWDHAGEGDLRPIRPTPGSFHYSGPDVDAPRIADWGFLIF